MTLIELIESKSFLINEFTKKTKIGKTSIYKWNKDVSKIKLAYRAKIAKALDIELEEFEKILNIEMEKVK